MAGKSNLELKVGLFAFIALVILTLTVFSITDINILRPGYEIKVCFSFASGIDTGASVRVAGIDVGEVKNIKLMNKGENRIILSVWLDREVTIPRDSQAYVNVLGLIGETYLEIVPGEDYTCLLKAGDVLTGRDPLSTETLMEVVHKVGINVDSVLGSLNEVLDEQTTDDLKETVHNFREFSENMKIITGRLQRGEGKLGRWLAPKKKRERK